LLTLPLTGFFLLGREEAVTRGKRCDPGSAFRDPVSSKMEQNIKYLNVLLITLSAVVCHQRFLHFNFLKGIVSRKFAMLLLVLLES
jgi:hypothetical protein